MAIENWWSASALLPRENPAGDDLGGYLENFDRLVLRRLATNEFHLAARTINHFRQETNQSLIGRRVNRRSCDADAEFRSVGGGDFCFRRAWLQFQRNGHAISMTREPRRERRRGRCRRIFPTVHFAVNLAKLRSKCIANFSVGSQWRVC